MKSKVCGEFADYFGGKEITFSEEAGSVLSAIEWAKPLLAEDKISRALKYKFDPKKPCTYYNQMVEIKSAFFEVRFAYAIYKSGCTARYEYDAGIGDSTIDFFIEGKENQPDWLIELTSLRDSEAIKENTWKSGNDFGYASISNSNENSPEVRNLIKTQQAILSKVTNENGFPIKFPLPRPNKEAYNLIVVDARALLIADTWDFRNIIYGSKILQQVQDGIYCRLWIDKNGKSAPLLGIFDTSHTDPKTKCLQERIHAVGFVIEEKYEEGEINSKIKFFVNPHLILISEKEVKNFRSIFPLTRARKIKD